MKKMILLLCLLIFIVLACSTGASNKALCFAAVQTEFPNGQVVVLGKDGYTFLVKSVDGSIWYIETLSSDNPNISFRRKIFTK